MALAAVDKKEFNNGLEDASTGVILESISDGVFTVDQHWRITSFNRAAEEITGIPRCEAIGRPCQEVFRASMCETRCALRSTMKTGEPIINRSAYFVNPDGNQIPVSVSTALLKDAAGKVMGGVETFRDLSLVEELRKELTGRFRIGDIVSRSPAMRGIFDILPQVAESASTVLIQGETGTGKELLAKAIHSASRRKNHPFVAVNASALPDTLLESELFGYRAGAFTGAHKDKPGRFAMAHKGSLFLDEIGDISPALQVRLLRVLQARSVEPLGGTQSVRVDVRVIAATNKDLSALMDREVFRKDLYYRINVVKMTLPPLRERKEDIPLLVAHFVERLNRLQGKSIGGVGHEALAMLMAHDYPGNIRELENIIEHGFVLCAGDEILPQHLPVHIAPQQPSGTLPMGMKHTVRTVESDAILAALIRHGYNCLAAANELGIHKSTLYRKIKSLNIDLPNN